MDEKNWNLASNSQIKEELENLESEFKEKQTTMKTLVEEINSLDESMRGLSEKYLKIREILNKREGKTKE